MIYYLEAYEIHAQEFAVEASSPADAIKAFWGGEGEPTGLSKFVESCDDLGLSAEEVPEIYAELAASNKLDDFIPCIRSVRKA